VFIKCAARDARLRDPHAEAVAAWIDHAGLEAVGTGEASPVEGQGASRRVECTVLVWGDEAPKPAHPPSAQ
jgi:hypothetical protein